MEKIFFKNRIMTYEGVEYTGLMLVFFIDSESFMIQFDQSNVINFLYNEVSINDVLITDKNELLNQLNQ